MQYVVKTEIVKNVTNLGPCYKIGTLNGMTLCVFKTYLNGKRIKKEDTLILEIAYDSIIIGIILNGRRIFREKDIEQGLVKKVIKGDLGYEITTDKGLSFIVPYTCLNNQKICEGDKIVVYTFYNTIIVGVDLNDNVLFRAE